MRVRLVQFRRGSVTSDTAEALRKLEQRLSGLRVRLEVKSRGALEMGWDKVRKDPGPTGLPPECSAIPTGREVYLRLEMTKEDGPANSRRERELALLWAVAVPLGFVPFTRYPLPGAQDTVFHFMGIWGQLVENLLGAGRGEVGFPSFCCAAQVDVGKWEGGHVVEREVQAQLHRIGHNVGSVDGVMGNKTKGALQAVGLGSLPLREVVQKLRDMVPYVPEVLEKKGHGRLTLPNVDFSIHSFGHVHGSQTVYGADLQISGTGRFVIDVRGTS